jgi:hypothetical protein
MPIVPLHLGDIRLNEVPYTIDIPTYRVRDIIDFAPRAAEPGGSIIHSELGLYQPYLKTDWRHGLGFMWEEDAMGYLNTAGALDSRHKGMIMMMTAPVDDSEAVVYQGFTSLTNMGTTDDTSPFDYTVAWGSDGMRFRSASDSAWAAVEASDTTATFDSGVNFVLETNSYLLIFPDGERVLKMRKDGNPAASDSGNVSITGQGDSSIDYLWALMHEGRIWAAKEGVSQLHHSSLEDLSDLEGDVDDPGVVLIGGNLPIPVAKTYLGKLLVGRQDGLFQIDMASGEGGAGGSARRLLDFSNQTSPNNFRFLENFNNKLIFPIRDVIYMWNGATLSDITPPFLSDVFPFTTYGRFDNGVAVGRFLFMTARTNEATYQEHLLAFDGVGWHKLADIITDGSGEVTAMGYDVVNNYLWYSVDDSTDSTNYIQFQNLSEFPYANFSTSGVHRFTSSRMGMGFRRVTKSTPSILVEARNVTANRYLEVHYQLDGGTIFEWGGAADGTGSTACRITSDGVTTLTNPTGDADGLGTLEYNYMQIIIDFVTDSSLQSPVLEGYTLRFIMRPQTLYGHFFNIVAASNLKVGASHRDLKSVRDIYSGINTARSSAAPISFTDPFGVTVQGYISSIERRAVERHGRTNREGFPNIESRILVNFVEVG